MSDRKRVVALAVFAAGSTLVAPANAIDVPNVGGETLSLDISNTTQVGYHFDNRNDKAVDPANPNLKAADHVDDDYGEWFNRLYLRANWGKFSAGLRLDSALFFNTMSRQQVQDLLRQQIPPNGSLSNENQFGRELHNRYTSFVYPAKLFIQYKLKWLQATVGDFYAHVGRGLVFSVRKIDDVGVDTTVRGGKIRLRKKWDGFRIEGTVFGGQLNPIRLDFATGRVLSGAGSPLFFAFPGVGGAAYPRVTDFEFFTETNDPNTFIRERDQAKPSYLEDNVVGATVKLGPKAVKFGLNGALLVRQSNSEAQQRCIAAGTEVDTCRALHPSFRHTESSRGHDQIRSASVSVQVPPIKDTVDAYVEGAIQHQVEGQVGSIDPVTNSPVREEDIFGYAIYANVNVTVGRIGATIEGKHYRSYFPVGANIDPGTQLGFAAPEYGIVTYNRPPNIESIYTEPIGNPDVCNTGGRVRIDASLSDHLKIYGWLGRSVSFTEHDDKNRDCETSDAKRTDTWDTAVGAEIDSKTGKTHYWAWLGSRFTDRPVSELINPELTGPTSVFYREAYIRYDFSQHLSGNFTLGFLGYHRRRYEPIALAEQWHEGENLVALNWNPHWAFIFGYEYQTRPGFPTHYFNGAVQFRSQTNDEWYGQVFDLVRLYVGQRRAALRCVGGVCRVFPAFEGAKLEIASRF